MALPSYLDQFLGSLGAAQQGLAAGAAGLDKVAQVNARDQLISQAESLDPEIGPLLASSARAGDMGPLQDFLKQRLKPQTQGQRLTAADIATGFGLSPEKAAIVERLPSVGEQRQLAASMSSASGRQAELGIKYQDADRREKAPARTQRQQFVNSFSKVQKDLKEKDLKYKNVREALEKGTNPADAIVFNFLARDVAGEKGPLSDSDISRFASRAFGGDLQKAQNFLSGETTSTLTGQQQQAFRELVEQAIGNYETFKQDVVATQLSSALVDFDALAGEKVDAAIVKRAKDYGFKIETADDGTYALVKEKPAKRQKVSPEEADLSKAIERIQDPTIKAQAREALSEAAKRGVTIPETVKQAILNAAGG